jgi:hypothetical protein
MVELEPEDYSNIIRWFENSFAKKMRMEEIPQVDKRTFWKLTFLCEDKIREIKELHSPV